MIDIITPVDEAPCRSCLHEREDGFDGCVGLKGFECVLGHTPLSFAMYGSSSNEDGQTKCSDYLHDDRAW
jgi:hypothetical protein